MYALIYSYFVFSKGPQQNIKTCEYKTNIVYWLSHILYLLTQAIHLWMR